MNLGTTLTANVRCRRVDKHAAWIRGTDNVRVVPIQRDQRMRKQVPRRNQISVPNPVCTIKGSVREAGLLSRMSFTCFCCRDTTGLLYKVCHLQSGRSAMNSRFRRAASREREPSQLRSRKTTEKNLSYCISGYKFTFLISLAFSRQPCRPIQMSLAMT